MIASLEPSSKRHLVQRRLHNSKFSLRNHLLSIEKDAEAVSSLASLFPELPLIANLRNGVWYTQNKTCTCYFKSTDGHINNWTFSSKRLNLDVALKASQSQGCIIVDSTRRGKRFPDSMSHTIPIWCGVLNHVVIGTDIADSLSLPPWTPSSLADSICSCFKTIVSGLHTDVVELIRSNLCGVLHRPLRPVWCSAEEGMIEWFGTLAEDFLNRCEGADLEFVPVVLFSCSVDISENSHSEQHSWHYIKGAGDDEEHWCLGLTPKNFWRFKDVILAEGNSDSDVVSLVEELMLQFSHSNASDDIACDYSHHAVPAPLVIPSTGVTLYSQNTWNNASESDTFDGILEVSSQRQSRGSTERADHYCFIKLVVGTQKKMKLRNQYPEIISQALRFYFSLMKSCQSKLPKFCIISEGDQCTSLLITISILVAYFCKPVLSDGKVVDEDEKCVFLLNSGPLRSTSEISKNEIKLVASIVHTACSEAPQVSRGLMQEIMKYFLSPDPVDLKERHADVPIVRAISERLTATDLERSRLTSVLSYWDKLAAELSHT